VPLDREREREGLDHESTRMVDTRGDRHGRSTERHRRDLPPPRTPHQRERERERESERERGRECACVRERECERVPSPLTPHQRERERVSDRERGRDSERQRERGSEPHTSHWIAQVASVQASRSARPESGRDLESGESGPPGATRRSAVYRID